MLGFQNRFFDLLERINNIAIEGSTISDIYLTDPLYRDFSIKLAVPLNKSRLIRLT